MVYSGNEGGSNYGVGILMDKTIINSLMSWKAISDRIILARFYTRMKKISIIQCYAPTEIAHDEAKDTFYNQLSTAINSIPKTDIVILLGDLNAKVGAQQDSIPKSIMGSHGMGTINNNGERLVNLCLEYNMAIGGTLFPHKNIHKYTWESPDGRTKNKIDHICISRKWKQSLLDVRAWRGADIDSDHNLLTGDIRLRPSKIRNTLQRRKRKLPTYKLKMEGTKQEFVSSIQQISQSTNISNIQEMYRQIADETLGTIENTRKIWLSNDTWSKIEHRKKLRTKMLTQQTDDLKAEYREVAREVKRCARRDKRRYYDSIATEAQSAAEQNNMRLLYNKIRTLANHRTRLSQPIKDSNGQLLTSAQEQMQRWKEHFEYMPTTINQAQANNESLIRPPPLRINQNPPSKREIMEAIAKMKKNRAEGPDGIPAELLQADPKTTSDILLPILVEVWNSERMPDIWKQGIIVKLPKKGDLRECSNWRGITILNVLNKVLANIILGRISSKIEESLREEQSGFRKKRGSKITQTPCG
ncbi:uncharacterized protein LOC129618814 [Condylostylus longicornis]|uniref:uncharacterized protein LOC129618814 n=1 Tax=Condylostylus longicornis TaxID=2530218 RepID=UPI00244E0CFF|nr:uncharacterized protein LOC129618814 [Condylostylus longicornis]